MYYSKFTDMYEKISKTNSQHEKSTILAEFLKKINKEGKKEWIYLLRGKTFPDYDPREYGISDKLVIKAISRSTGIKESDLVKRLRKIGDLGELAKEFTNRKQQSTLFTSKLTVDKVFTNLKKLVEINGKGSVDKKLTIITEILNSATGDEAKYVTRTLLSDLRIGVADGLLRDAISEAFFNKDKEMTNLIEAKYDLANDYALIFETAINGKVALEKITVTPGRPMKVMLPVKVTDINEAFRICGKPAAIEHKYDGFRVLINKDHKGNISLFTRKLDDVTNQFPDVVNSIKKHVRGKSFILDSEVVGYDPKTKKYKPFESISQRIKRKYNIDNLVKSLPVEINVFDIIFYNEKVLTLEPFKKRRALLESIINKQEYVIKPSSQFVTDSEELALEFYNKALKIGEEGIMIKKLDAPYHPGRRVGYMAKMKPDQKEFDLVITGAEYGSGKRAGWLTSYIVSCKSNGDFLEIGKVSSGLKEKGEGTTYEEMTNMLKKIIIKEKGKEVQVKPLIIVAVNYQNIQKSPTYSSGYALRFPRIINYRPERKTHDIATLDEIKNEIRKSHIHGIQ